MTKRRRCLQDSPFREWSMVLAVYTLLGTYFHTSNGQVTPYMNPLIDFSAIETNTNSSSIEINNDNKISPELETVFPKYAEKFASFREDDDDDPVLGIGEDAEMERLVKSSDFAVIDSETESFGSVEEIEDHLPAPFQDSNDDLMSEGTTVMLFNIFTPEEVSFLSSLVGEDVVEELKENDVLLESEEESKNVGPSSQEIDQGVSNIRESLKPYQIFHNDGFESTEEEGGSTGYDDVLQQRQKTMKSLLNRLANKYKKTRIENSYNQSYDTNFINSEEKEKMKRMKVMIDNLRSKLENSGKNDLNTSSSSSAQRRTFESILGAKLRNLNSGVHRVNLEDILESDLKLSNNKRLEDPLPPPSALKRQIPKLHPKLTHKRPQTSIVHRPSMNLKNQIKPIEDKVDPGAIAYRSLPLIDRYQTSPQPRIMDASNVKSLPLFQHTSGPKIHTAGFDENPFTKELPLQKPAPLISSDPFPDTKELPPYHFPSARPYIRQESIRPPPLAPYVPPMRINPPSFPFQVPNKPPETTKIPTTLYYPKMPLNFDPTKKPKTSYDKKKTAMPNLKYVSSNTYRSKGEKKSKKLFSNHVDRPAPGTEYPAPSYKYKEPSLKFKDFGELSIAVTPKNVPHTGTTVKSYRISSPENSQIISLPDPRDHYFPKSLQFLSGVHSTTPNIKSPKYTTMKPPQMSFTPSSFSHESTTSEYKLPQYESHTPQDHHPKNVLSTTMKTPTKEYSLPPSKVTTPSLTQYRDHYRHKTTRVPQRIESPITQGYKYLKKINNIYDEYVEHKSPENERLKHGEIDDSTQMELIAAYQNLFSLLGFSTDFKSTFQHFMPLSNNRFKKQKKQQIRPKQLFHNPPKNIPNGQFSHESLKLKSSRGSRGSTYPPDTEYIPSIHPHSDEKFHYKKNNGYESSGEEFLNENYHDIRVPIHGYKSPISNGPGKGSVIIKGDHEHPPDTQYIPPFDDNHSFSHGFFNSKVDRNLLLVDEEVDQKEIDMMQSYLPPHIEYIHPASSRVDKIPSIRYLPPPPRTESHPHAKFILPSQEDIAKFSSYTVPSKKHGYLPPPKTMDRLIYPTKNTELLTKSDPSNILHLKDQKYYKVPSKSEKKVNDSSLNIKVHSNDDKEQHKVTIVSSGDEKTNGLKHSPHSINIEINIPSKDEINLLNGGEKFHVKRKIGEIFPTSRAIVYRPHLLPLKQNGEDSEGEYITNDSGPKMNVYTQNIESHILDQTEPKVPLHLDPTVSRLKPPLVKELKVPRLISTLESPSLNKYGSSNETKKSFPNYLPPHENNEKVPPNLLHDGPSKDLGFKVPEEKYLPPHKDNTAEGIQPPRNEYLPPKYTKFNNAPNKNYFPPEYEKGLRVPDGEYLPPKNELGYKTPEKDYTSPNYKKGIRPPNQEYQSPNIKDNIKPPNSEYLPPKHKNGYYIPGKEYQGPKYNSGIDLPSKDYLPPDYSSGIKPPSSEYLPPKGYGATKKEPHYSVKEYGDTMKPPEKEYLQPQFESGFEVPTKDYLPPKYDKGYELPNADYIPPKYESGYNLPSSQYIPPKYGKGLTTPNKEYLPPQYGKGYDPPNKDYLPPKYDNGIKAPTKNYAKPGYGRGYDLPNQEYLPPKFSEGFEPPDKKYLPPGYETGYNPPREEYGVPIYNKGYNLPNKEYLPPKEGAKINLPSRDYLPPKYSKGFKAPTEGYNSPKYKSGLGIPNKEYLPPHYEKGFDTPNKEYDSPEFTQGYKLPSKGYDSPHYKNGYSIPSTDYRSPSTTKGYIPPGKEYDSPNYKKGYLPPTKDYNSPNFKPGYNIPSKEYGAPKYEKGIRPPSEEYGAPNYEKGIHLPSEEYGAPHYEKGIRPPSEEYGAPNYEKGIRPPSEEYGSPHYENGIRPPNEEYGAPNYEKGIHLPSEEYGAPHYEKGIRPPSEEYGAPHYEKGIRPPSEEYGSPHYEKGIRPPSEEYGAPHYEKGIRPPSEEYGSPHYEKGIRPPSEEYGAPNYEKGIHLPSEEYGAPNYEKGIHPPNKEYGAPHYEKGIHLPSEEYGAPQYEKGIHPPGKEYLAPNYNKGIRPPSQEYGAPNYKKGIRPPSEEYGAPHYEKGIRPPNEEYGAPKYEKGIHPPGEEYLSPNYNKGIHPPNKEYGAPNYKKGINLPREEYGAPHYEKGIHLPNEDYRTPEYEKGIRPPGGEYERPHYEKGIHPPKEGYSEPKYKKGYKPPTSGYLSPGYTEGIPIPDKDYLSPGYDVGLHLPTESYHSPLQKPGSYNLPHHEYESPKHGSSKHMQSSDGYLPPNYNYDKQTNAEEENLYLQDNTAGLSPPIGGYLNPSTQHSKAANNGYLPPRDESYSPSPSDHFIPENDGYLPPYDKKRNPFLSSHKNKQSRPNPNAYLPPQDDYSSKRRNPNAYLPPQDDYNSQRPKDNVRTHNKDGYLPPDHSHDEYSSNSNIPFLPNYESKSISSKYISPSGVGSTILPKYVAAPSRGPQFKEKKMEYVDPPPRPIVNSQVEPPTESEEKYIPPKEDYELPKNYLSPDDAFKIKSSNVDNDDKEEKEEVGSREKDVEEVTLPEKSREDVDEAQEPRLRLRTNETKEEKNDQKSERLTLLETKLLESNNDTVEPILPPIPTLPPQPDSFLPLLKNLSPDVLQELNKEINGPPRNGKRKDTKKIPGVAGRDYPDFKTIPNTDFSCQNFILEGFYADTFTSCQVFHVCESGRRQSSFLCPKGTIFNQKHRVCDWWYNVKCEDSTEFYDLNLDLLLLEGKSKAELPDVPPPVDPLQLNALNKFLASSNDEKEGDGIDSLMDELLSLNGFDDLEELSNEIRNAKKSGKIRGSLKRHRKNKRRRKKQHKKGRNKAQQKRKSGGKSAKGGSGASELDLCELLGICGELKDSMLFPFAAASSSSEVKVKPPPTNFSITVSDSGYLPEEERSPKMIESSPSLQKNNFPHQKLINQFYLASNSSREDPEWTPVLENSASLLFKNLNSSYINDRTLNLQASDDGWRPFDPSAS